MNETVKKKGNSCDIKSGRNIYTKASDIISVIADTANNDCKRHHVQRERNHTQQHSTIIQTRILNGEILNSFRFYKFNESLGVNTN